MTRRRELTFTRLEDVPADVERLLDDHGTVGRWSLGQILNHLATAIRVTVEGPPASLPATREQDVTRRRFLRSGKFPEGMEAPLSILVPKPGLEAGLEAAALRAAINRFVAATGPFVAHPALGPMSKDEWTRFHCMHCAHHLGFAAPGKPH